MAVYYVSEGTGSDETGDGSQGNPWGTVRYALDHMSGPDVLYFATILIAHNKPNAGINGYVRTYFVDPANGTDDGSHGNRDGDGAWASLQYALDSVDAAGSNAWIFCTGSESPSATIDVDTGGGANGRWKIVEGYGTDPRDGGYYVIDGQDSLTTGMEWANVDGILLANLHIKNCTGEGMNFGNPGSDSGQVCWRCWVEAVQYGFRSQNSANSPVLLFCKARAQTGFELAYAQPAICVGCYAYNCSTRGYSTQSRAVFYRCVAKDCGDGFLAYSSRAVCIGCLACGCSGDGFAMANRYGILVGLESIAKSCGNRGFDRYDGDYNTWGLWVNCCAHGNGINFYDYAPVDGLLQADPQLVDAAGEDFRLKSSSPCFNGGVEGLHNVLTQQQFAHIGPHVQRFLFPVISRAARVGNPQGAAML
ncbi:MAG: hypothetical protein ACE5K7_04420 [Phycisphaerae bacterium]